MNTNNKIIEALPNLCVKLDLVSIYDLGCYSTQELLYALGRKINEIIMEHNRYEEVINDNFLEVQKRLEWLLNEGLIVEVEKMLNKWMLDGTLEEIINDQVFSGLNDKIDKVADEAETVVLPATFATIQAGLDYCRANNKNARLMRGTYTITEPLNIRGVNFKGDGPENTRIVVKCPKAFVLHQYESQKPVTIEGFGFIGDGTDDSFDRIAIAFDDTQRPAEDKAAAKRSRGYKLENLYFEQLGRAIDITDCFRVNVSKIGCNQVYNPMLIRGQAVQVCVSDFTANCDLDPKSSVLAEPGFAGNLGILIKGSRHNNDVYERPESVKMWGVSCVGYQWNLVVKDVLFASFESCDFDLAQISAVVTQANQGGLYFTNTWMSSNTNKENTAIVDIQTPDNVHNKIVFTSCTITSLDRGHATQKGVRMGQFRRGVSFKDCTISALGPVKLAYGIYADRPKELRVTDCSITDCTVKSIYLEQVDTANIIGNYCDAAIKIESNVSNPIIMYGNQATIEKLGTVPITSDYIKGDIEHAKSEFTAQANETVAFNHNLGIPFEKLTVEAYYIVGDGYAPCDANTKIKVVGNTGLTITNMNSSAKGYLIKVKV